MNYHVVLNSKAPINKLILLPSLDTADLEMNAVLVVAYKLGERYRLLLANL